jgi:hypothetical protein
MHDGRWEFKSTTKSALEKIVSKKNNKRQKLLAKGQNNNCLTTDQKNETGFGFGVFIFGRFSANGFNKNTNKRRKGHASGPGPKGPPLVLSRGSPAAALSNLDPLDRLQSTSSAHWTQAGLGAGW